MALPATRHDGKKTDDTIRANASVTYGRRPNYGSDFELVDIVVHSNAGDVVTTVVLPVEKIEAIVLAGFRGFEISIGGIKFAPVT